MFYFQVFRFQKADDICDNFMRRKCTGAKEGNYKFYLSNPAVLKKVTNFVTCFEAGSEVYVQTKNSDNTGLQLISGVLEVHQNASFIITNDNSLCRIDDRSFVMVQNLLKINSASIYVWLFSEIINCGIIEVDAKSKLLVTLHSLVEVSTLSRLRLKDCKIYIEEHSILEVGDDFVPSDDLKTSIMKCEGSITLNYFAVVSVFVGQLQVTEAAELKVYHHGTFLTEGYVKITNSTTIVGDVCVGMKRCGFNSRT